MKKIFIYCMVFIFAFVTILPIQANTVDDVKDKKSSVDSKLDDLRDKKAAEQARLQREKEKREQIDAAQDVHSMEYKKLLDQINKINSHISELNDSIKKSEQEYNDQKEQLKKRLRVMYENSNISYVQTLMESRSVVEFLEKVQLISQITRNDQQLLRTIEGEKRDIEDKKKMSEQLKHTRELMARSKKAIIDSLTSSRAATENSIEQIRQSLDEIERQEDQLAEESRRLSSEILRLMSSGGYYGGIMVWPSPSCHSISSDYGMRYHPILHKYKLHTGIDIPASYGTSIVAANNGRVIIAGWQNGYGNTVVIDHGGNIATLYGHQSSILVYTGQFVKAGQVIGRVGSTGWSTGPHLHFEVIVNGSTVDPKRYVT